LGKSNESVIKKSFGLSWGIWKKTPVLKLGWKEERRITRGTGQGEKSFGQHDILEVGESQSIAGNSTDTEPFGK